MKDKKRELKYEFFTYGKLDNDVNDDRVRVAVDIVTQLFSGFDYGPRVPETRLELNKQALRNWEGTIIGGYPGTWDDIYVVGNLMDNDTIQADVMWKADYESYLAQHRKMMN